MICSFGTIVAQIAQISPLCFILAAQTERL
jgi:hypothetical protein